MKERIIGADEVGKVEAFKQMMSVAVYKNPEVETDFKTGDSKKNSKSGSWKTGKAITGFSSFDEVESRAYVNENYGIVYAVRIISNEEYNSWKEKSKDINANVILSYAHNDAIRMVYDKVKELGWKVDKIVIDDFISTNVEHEKQFGEYIKRIDKNMKTVNELSDVEMIMTPKAEDKYPDTVGTASIIGDYIDQLWQVKVKEKFGDVNIDFLPAWFGNGNEISDLLQLIIEKCGSLDESPVVMKHTSYYEKIKKI